MDPVILDTDVSSLSPKRRLPSPALTRLIGKQPCITFVTLVELTQWAELRRWGRRNRDALDSWLDGVIILPYSEDVARTWGRISAVAIQRGRPQTSQRHLDRRVRPNLWPAARDPQRQGLQGLRRA